MFVVMISFVLIIYLLVRPMNCVPVCLYDVAKNGYDYDQFGTSTDTPIDTFMAKNGTILKII